MVKFKVIRLCKEDAVSVVPTEMLRYDLDRAAKLLEGSGYEVVSQGLMIIAKGSGHEIYATVEGSLEPSLAKRS
jgi:hypothetical protein